MVPYIQGLKTLENKHQLSLFQNEGIHTLITDQGEFRGFLPSNIAQNF